MLRDGTKKAIWGISIAVIVFFLIIVAGIFMGFEGIGKILLFVLCFSRNISLTLLI